MIPDPDRRTPVFERVTRESFERDIRPLARPAILKGLVSDWPSVEAGRRSEAALADHIRAFDTGTPVRVVSTEPALQGRFFYNDDLTALNFSQRPGTVSEVLDSLLADAGVIDPYGLAVQAAPEPDVLPGFGAANPQPLVDPETFARLWIGNAITVQTHHDLYENIACAVAGRRRFILFPPAQTRNLYIGPFETTPAGALVSMVRLEAPDHARFPRFADAWAEAELAELEPGDALYIPYMWWHHVRSLDAFSVLANYWWNPAPAHLAPMPALIHAMMSVRDLPADQREAWAGMFEAFVFGVEAPAGRHLPTGRQGIQKPMDAAAVAQVREILARTLSQPQ